MIGRRFKWAAVALSVLIGAGAAFSYQRTRALSVEIVPVQRNVDINVFGLGTVEAEKISKIGFETNGVITGLHADHGDRVKAGDLLARLHSDEQAARVQQARAAIAQAEAVVKQAEAARAAAEATFKQKSDADARRKQLAQREVISQEAATDAQAAAEIAKAQLLQAESGIAVAHANLRQAQASLKLEEAKLAKYSLHAPFDGLVVAKHKELGAALGPSEPVFTIIDPATLWTLAYVDETRAGSVALGQAAVVTKRSSSEEKMIAKVVRIDIESDRVNEERRIYVRCGACPSQFNLGEQAEVLIKVAQIPEARMVKLTSLSHLKAKTATAWTVENDQLNQRVVQLGLRTLDGRVQITDGLPDGAEVAEGSGSGFRVGRAVRVVNLRQPK